MIVGLTGGIGSGKTWVSSLFADLGIPIYISDIEAKKLMHSNAEVKHSIIKIFGNEAYVNDQLNRNLIAQKVFTDKILLEQLNAAVHPVVELHFKDWYKNQEAPFVIKESAILFETGGEKKCNTTILITAPKLVRVLRVQKRDKTSVDEIEKRMNNQWEDDKKIILADHVIENIEKNKTKQQVQKVYDLLLC